MLATSVSIPTLSNRLKVKPNAVAADQTKPALGTSIIQKGATKPSRVIKMIPKSNQTRGGLESKENEPVKPEQL